MRAPLSFVLALAAAGCAEVRPFITPEGNIAFGPRNAATAPGGVPASFDDHSVAPTPHVSRSAYDTWRPPPIGILPPGNVLHNTSQPVLLQAGGLGLTVRSSDRIVPAWGGDVYLRVDLQTALPGGPPTPRDLVVILDARDHASLVRERRIAADLFATLHAGDRAALLATSEGGRAIVPIMPYAAVPLLIERSHSFEPTGHDDLDGALEHAVTMLADQTGPREQRLVVLSGSSAILDAEDRQWIEGALQSHVQVELVPFTPGTAVRFERMAALTHAHARPEVVATDAHEAEAVRDLSGIPAAPPVADDVTIRVESLPGPFHLIEVAGAEPVWTESGGEVPLGTVHPGEDRTLVLRGSVPPWQAGLPFDVTIAVGYRDERGVHEVRETLSSVYSNSPVEQAASRAGDVLQYVSLLNTLSNVQAALTRNDPSTFLSLRDPAWIQARTLQAFAREHGDRIMGAQAALLEQLISTAPSTWVASNP